MADSDNGLANIPSRHSVGETVQNVERILQAKGIKLFALIDHSGEAESAGLKMRPTKLVLFGNPMAGTPLMLAAPTTAIDLPLKFLVWEDVEGRVWITYNMFGSNSGGKPWRARRLPPRRCSGEVRGGVMPLT